MPTPVPMPALSPTMTEGKITKWLKKEGDKVASGEAIAEVETDKSNLEVEAYDDGSLLRIAVKEGETAPVGAPIAFIGQPGEKVELPPTSGAKVPEKAAPVVKATSAEAGPRPLETAPPEPAKVPAPAPPPTPRSDGQVLRL